MDKLMSDALSALRKAYPDALLVVGPVKGNLRRPCLQLTRTGMGLRRELSRRWRRSDELTLCWYPPDGEQPEEKAGELLLLLSSLRPFGRAETGPAEDHTLRCRLETETICFLTEEEAEKMKKQVLEMQLKLQQ